MPNVAVFKLSCQQSQKARNRSCRPVGRSSLVRLPLLQLSLRSRTSSHLMALPQHLRMRALDAASVPEVRYQTPKSPTYPRGITSYIKAPASCQCSAGFTPLVPLLWGAEVAKKQIASRMLTFLDKCMALQLPKIVWGWQIFRPR